jgi:Uma2 family endonuclease
MSTALRWTTVDLETLPDDGKRYEIVDGELYVSRQPHSDQQYTCGEVFFALQEWSKRTGAGRAYFTPGLVFGDEDDVVPDVAWISTERLATAINANGHFRVAPELVVEVLSPGSTNERRDREAKLKLYSRRGVHEYWIVDGRQRQVALYRREQAALRLIETLFGQDDLRSPLLPNFLCRVA